MIWRYLLLLAFKILDKWVRKNPKGNVFDLYYYTFLEQVVFYEPALRPYTESFRAIQVFSLRKKIEEDKTFREREERIKFQEALEEKEKTIKDLTSNTLKSPAMRRNFIKR
jgi:hypothetical protein